MTMTRGRVVTALSGHLTMRDALLEEQQRLQRPDDVETFRLSVQFALVHGSGRAGPRGEITTLRSSTLLSGACSR